MTGAEVTTPPAEAVPRVQSAARTVGIILAVADSDHGLTTREISESVGIGRQTVYHLLHTLTETGMLARGEDGRIVLGLNAGRIAAGFDKQLSVSERLAPLVRQLAARTDETAYAAGWHLREITVHTVARGSKPIQTAETPLGFTGFAHARASGKLLLSQLTDEELDTYLATHPLVAVTDRTIISVEALATELASIRTQGYAVDDEEFNEGVCCLAVSLAGFRGPQVLAVSMPANRFQSSFDSTLAVLREAATLSTQ